jgi:hypothetical protein
MVRQWLLRTVDGRINLNAVAKQFGFREAYAQFVDDGPLHTSRQAIFLPVW